MTQIIAFGWSTVSPDSFETSTYFVPFVTPNYYYPNTKITNDSILIAESSHRKQEIRQIGLVLYNSNHKNKQMLI